MNDLIDNVGCPDCKDSLIVRVKDIVTKWMLLPVSSVCIHLVTSGR